MWDSSSSIEHKPFPMEIYCCLESRHTNCCCLSLQILSQHRSFNRIPDLTSPNCCARLWGTSVLPEGLENQKHRAISLFIIFPCRIFKVVSLLAEVPNNSDFWKWVKGEFPFLHSLPCLCCLCIFCLGSSERRQVPSGGACGTLVGAVRGCWFKESFNSILVCLQPDLRF